MYARHVTVHGSPDNIDAAIESVRNGVLPILQGCPGFQAQLLLVDRSKGEAIGVSLWDTEENMLASEEKVQAARNQTADEVGHSGTPEVSLYELPIYETA